jgi:nitrate reductase NapAB chaperone NapD
MPVSSIVVVLSPDLEARREALATLAADPRVTLGPMERDRLAVVTESTDTRACTAHLAELEALPGVLAVQPVFHDFSDEVP